MLDFLLVAVGLGIAGLIALIYGFYALRTEREAQHVQEVLTQQGGFQAPTAHSLETKIVTGSFASRTFTVLFEEILKLAGRLTPANSIRHTAQMLTLAGNPLNLQPTTYYGLRIVLLVVGVILTLLSIRFFGVNSMPSLLQAYLVMLIFYATPIIWLRTLAQRRRQKIREELPDALDLLSVLASAGFNFNQALARINEQWDTVLGKEFGRVISEIELGISLEDAMKNFAGRADVAELTSFVAVIVQSNRMGIRIADVLYTQAEQMRILRQYRAKELAQRMPARMMIPLALFILPALIYIIIVPAFLTVVVQFSQ
jgi:tight adherence protein C